jgi:hypothetical protein
LSALAFAAAAALSSLTVSLITFSMIASTASPKVADLQARAFE